MKYLLFAWWAYEASGGSSDFVGAFDSIDEAKAAFGKEHGMISTFDGERFTTICEYTSLTNGKQSFTGWDDDPRNPFRKD